MELKTKNQSVDTPESWAQTPLKNICTLHNGRAFHRSEWESQGTPVIRLQNLTGGDDYYYSTLNLPSNKYCSEGDLLYMWSASFGPMIWKGPEAIYHYHIWKVDINADAASKNFLYFKLDEITQRLKERETSGSTMLHLTKQKMEKTEVLLPPLPEQRAIAEALSDVDALIERLDALIAKQRAIKTATMQRLLTGQQRLPGFDGKWSRKTVLDLVDHSKSLFDDGDWIESEYITNRGIRLIQTGNIGIGRFIEKEDKKYISQDSFDTLNCKDVKVGDLLICRLADPAGRACIMPDIGEDKMITAVDVTIFRPLAEQADPRYLENLFSTSSWFEKVKLRSGGSTRKRIARGALGKIELRLPSVKEQRAIATILSDMDAEIEALQARRDKTQAIKQGMMQELLTGRTRLV